MSFWTNYSNKAPLSLILIFLLLAGGCTLLEDKGKDTLRLQRFVADRRDGLIAHLTSIRWIAETTGGEGEVLYEFRSKLQGEAEYIEQKGNSSKWEWTPRFPGIYHVKVVCRDKAGGLIDSGWSDGLIVSAPVAHDSFFAILPVENLSGVKAPVQQIYQRFFVALEQNNIHLQDRGTLEEFMKKYRMRYTGGINHAISGAFREKGVNAVFIVSLEAFEEKIPPKISLFARLVSCDTPQPEILWMEGVGLTGDDSPGLFGVGRIRDLDRLLEKAVSLLMDSLNSYLAQGSGTKGSGAGTSRDLQNDVFPAVPEAETEEKSAAKTLKGKYAPKTSYRSPEFNPERVYNVAVVPFLNINARKNAGEVVALHFVNQLLRYRNFTVIEPGVVREELLNNRLIMEQGPSLAVSDLLSGSGSLGADLVLSGKALDYQGMQGAAKVDFSTQIIDGKLREIILSSRSYGAGDDGVFFFDIGRVYSAHDLLGQMSGFVIDLLQD